jgi:DNA-binding transcriptional LysR family regulator
MDERLQKFARLVEVGSFTRAAKQLHISQPALSIAIDKLEQELGTELIVRGNRRLDITATGQAAYEAAIQQQNIADHLRSAINRLAHKKPDLTLGMTDSIAAQLCVAPSFEELDKAARLTIVVNNSRYLREAVANRSVDVAFIIDDGGEHPGLQKQISEPETLVLVGAPVIAAQATADIARGKLRNFISYDKPSTTYRHVTHFFQILKVKPNTAFYSTSPDVMLQMVLRGKGIAVLPEQLVRGLIKDQSLAVISHCGNPVTIKRPTCRLQLKGRILPDCLNEFLNSY